LLPFGIIPGHSTEGILLQRIGYFGLKEIGGKLLDERKKRNRG
jgi:hypothetical protein